VSTRDIPWQSNTFEEVEMAFFAAQKTLRFTWQGVCRISELSVIGINETVTP